MVPLFGVIAAASPSLAVGAALIGSLIGGMIAGSVSLVVARQAREAAEHSWIRDNRREIYDRFLTNAQRLLVACEASAKSRLAPTGTVSRTEVADEFTQHTYAALFDVYGVVQTVADRPVVDAVRVYAYRLLALKEMLDANLVSPSRFDDVAQLVRSTRHAAIDAMRSELGLTGSATPPKPFDPFLGTPLAGQYSRP
jgi:hypothetical protein